MLYYHEFGFSTNDIYKPRNVLNQLKIRGENSFLLFRKMS